MRISRRAVGAVLLLGLMVAVRPAWSDDPPVADPGSCFVDLDDDGLYGAGDVLVPDQVISNNGGFNTQASIAGVYSAPSGPANLVVPASSNLANDTALVLLAGRHIRVNGGLSAPFIYIRSGAGADKRGWGVMCHDGEPGRVDLTGALCSFQTNLNVSAGTDVILDGAVVAGPGTVGVFAKGDIRGTPGTLANGSPCAGPTVFVDTGIRFDAAGALTVASAYLWAGVWGDPTAFLELEAGTDLKVDAPDDAGAPATTTTTLYCTGPLSAKSLGGALTMGAVVLEAYSVLATADTAVTLTTSTLWPDTNPTPVSPTLAGWQFVSVRASDVLTCAGATVMRSGWPDPSFGIAGHIELKGTHGVSAAGLSATVEAGAITVTAADGAVALDQARIVAPGGMTVSGNRGFTASGASVEVLGGPVAFTSSNGPVNLAQSLLLCTGNVTVSGAEMAAGPGATFSTPGEVKVMSSRGNVDISGATVSCEGGQPVAKVTVTASNGAVDASGSTMMVSGPAMLSGETGLACRSATLRGDTSVKLTSSQGTIDASGGTSIEPLTVGATPSVTLSAPHGAVDASAVSVRGSGGVTVSGQTGIQSVGVAFSASPFVKLTSALGAIDFTDGSATSEVTGAYVTIQAGGDIVADGAQVTIPAKLTLLSSSGNVRAEPSDGGSRPCVFAAGQIAVTARTTGDPETGCIYAGGATFATPTTKLLAYGLLIEVPSASFAGTVTFGPAGVVVNPPVP